MCVGEAGPVVQLEALPVDHSVARTAVAWREQWQQLRLREWSAKSDGQRELQKPRLLGQARLDEVRVEVQRNDDDRQAWEKELWCELRCVRKRVSAVASNVQFAASHGDVPRMVQAVDRELRLYGEAQRQQYDELAELQLSLEESLSSMLTRFEGWCEQGSNPQQACSEAPRFCKSPIRSHSSPAVRSGRGRTDTGDAKESAALRAQVERLDAEDAASGGATGGWPSDDHDSFMHVFQKCRRRPGPDFLAAAETVLPGRTHEELVSHVAWLAAHEDRQDRRRALLERWRCERSAAALRAAEGGEAPSLTAREAQRERAQKSKEEQRQRQELADRKQQLADWRSEREHARSSAEEERQRREREAKSRAQERRQQEAEAKRQAVGDFKQLRAHEQRRAAERASSEPRTRTSPEDRRRIAERSASLLKQRRESATQRRAASCTSFAPPSRTSAYQDVESRVLGHAEAHAAKLAAARREEESAGSASGSKYGVVAGNFAHQGLMVNVRSCPSWRPGYGA